MIIQYTRLTPIKSRSVSFPISGTILVGSYCKSEATTFENSQEKKNELFCM